MFRKTKICASIAFAFGAGALGTMSAFAQDATQVQDSKKIERVEVTGTRIISANAEYASPVQVISSAEIAASGVANIQELLVKNPSLFIATSRNNSNFSTSSAGVATVDLRGIGADRTLVLVNGRRHVAGIPGSAQVDLNSIPTDFIERVEILTGGASATYGSDAVAGVVNIILKKGFEGISLDAQVGRSSAGDDDKKKASVTWGTKSSDGRGSLMAHMAVSQQGAVYSRDRDASAVDQTSKGASVTGLAEDMLVAQRPFYSSFAPQGRFFYADAAGNAKNYTYDAAGNPIPFSTNGPAGDGVGATGFNRSQYRTIAIPTDRYLISAKGDFNITEAHTAFFETTYAASSTKTVIEPYPLDSINIAKGTAGFIPAEFMVDGVKTRNPLVPDYLYNRATDRNGDGLKDYNFTRRLADIGNRGSEAERDMFRFVGGFKGELSKSWTYDVYAAFGSTKESQVSSGQVNVLNFNNALEAVTDINDLNGNGSKTDAVCRDANARAQGCVPINIFGANSISPAAAKYVNAPGSLATKMTQKVVAGTVTGDVFTLPAGEVSVAAGLEWREEFSSTKFDALTQAGLNAGNALPNTEGRFNVKEFFLEAHVPILKNLPLVKSLDANAAVRQGKYSTIGNSTSWTAGLEWAPSADLRFRGASAVSTRAPNVGELYSAPAQTFPPGLVDPCKGVTATATSAVAVACRQDAGVVANINANGGTFNQNQADKQGISGYDTGNPNLAAEKGKSLTLGMVFTPKSIPVLDKFAFTVDYFDISITDAIGTPGRQFTLDQCYGGGDASFCKFIKRRQNPAGSNSAGSLEFINQTSENSGGLKTAGVDLTAAYSDKVGPGRLSARGSWTHLTKYDYTPRPGSDVDSSLGEIGTPKDKMVLNINYDIGDFGFKTTTSYIASSVLDDKFLKSNDLEPGSVGIPSKTYVDLQATYKWNKAQFYFGIDNAFGTKAPPVISGLPGSTTGAETAAGTYDPIGRKYYLGVRYSM